MPQGFTRAGYDSNTRRYHFRDAEGRMYQGEPGEEFGGRMAPMNGIDPSMRPPFSPDDGEVGRGNVVGVFIKTSGNFDAYTPIDSPRTVQAEETMRPIPTSPTSFSDFLSSSQMAAAPSLEPPPKKTAGRGFTFSLRRVTTLGFRSTKSKATSATLPNPSPKADEWGRARF